MSTAVQQAVSIERFQEDQLFHRHGDLRPKDVMLAKLHRGQKWFDSGEYFLSKEGKAPSDLMPGGAPVDSLPPKLAPTPMPPRQHTALDQPPLVEEEWGNGPSVSDY